MTSLVIVVSAVWDYLSDTHTDADESFTSRTVVGVSKRYIQKLFTEN